MPAAKVTATSATAEKMVVRPPIIRREQTQRPYRSVPSGKAALGPSLMWAALVAVGSLGVSSGAARLNAASASTNASSTSILRRFRSRIMAAPPL